MADSASLAATEATLNATKNKLSAGYQAIGVKVLPPGLMAVLMQMLQAFLAGGGCVPKAGQTPAETVAAVNDRVTNHPWLSEIQLTGMNREAGIPHPWQAAQASLHALKNSTQEEQVAFASIDMSI